MMKHLLNIFLLSLLNNSFGQYSLDETINNHPFLKMVYFENNHNCGLENQYYEPVEIHFYFADKECVLLQERLKDTLRILFSHEELFEIAKYSMIPFYRIAAFDLYTQTNYSSDSVIRLLKNESINKGTRIIMGNSAGEIPEGYVALPCALEPSWSSIRLKMFEMVDPTATMVARKTEWSYDTIPKYPENIPLDYESYIELRAYLNSYFNGISSEPCHITNGKITPASFTFHTSKIDFGKIDLNQIGSNQSEFELRGSILVINNSNDTICISSKASAHTVCLKSKYMISPKGETMIEFKSLVNTNIIGPSINRSITLQNIKSGEAQILKFSAQFIK